MLTGARGVVGAHFFASDSSYSIFPSQGRFCQGRAERGLAIPLTGSSLRSIIPYDESLRGHKREAGVYSHRLVRAFIVIEVDKIVNLFPCFSWTLVIF